MRKRAHTKVRKREGEFTLDLNMIDGWKSEPKKFTITIIIIINEEEKNEQK